MRLPILLLTILGYASAAAVPALAGDGRFWPTKDRWRDAFRSAVRDPVTWAPAAGAAVLGIGGWDETISDWAVRETPVFGSTENALQWSDDLRTASHLGMLATLFLVDEPDSPWKEGTKRFIVQHISAVTATSLTTGLKQATDRERPDRSDRESFPSGHSSRAFSYAASARRNLRDSRLSPKIRIGLETGITAVAAGTAWARIEAGKHYPTDVLAGAALGNFVSILINDTFLEMNPNVTVNLDLGGDEPRFMVFVRW